MGKCLVLKCVFYQAHFFFWRAYLRGLLKEGAKLSQATSRPRHCCVANKQDPRFHPAQKTGTPRLKGNASLAGGPLGTTWQIDRDPTPCVWLVQLSPDGCSYTRISSGNLASLPRWGAFPLFVSPRNFSGLLCLCLFQMSVSLANPRGTGTGFLSV